jgi:cell division septation protein DedD
MSDAIVPSYRVQRPESGVPWRMLAVAGGLVAAVAVGAGGWWAFQQMGGARNVPIVEADPRPFKVRPDDPGGMRVPNQGELILERPAGRAQTAAQGNRTTTVAPEAEAPNLDRLRAAVAPPPPPVVPPQAVAAPAPAAQPGVPPAAQAPAPTPASQPAAAPAAAAQPAAPRPMTGGRVQVQLGALTSEEAARAEWDRLARRAPELFQGRSPLITRLDRGEGQPPLFRLRAGGLPDQEAAGQFCEQVRARGGACVPVRG